MSGLDEERGAESTEVRGLCTVPHMELNGGFSVTSKPDCYVQTNQIMHVKTRRGGSAQ